jgi:hypothetical protein
MRYLALSFLLFAICACAEDAPTTSGNLSPDQQISKARNMPKAPPATPSKHFRMSGKITFHDYSDATQQGELWLGGPGRMRFAIGGDGLKNIILLDTVNGCWKKTPGEDFAEYPSGAEVLTIETELRWFIMRMPWDNNDSRFLFEIGESGMPSKVSLDQTTVELSEYQPLGKKGAYYPTVWRWKSPTDNRTEVFSSLQDGALFLDNAFAPPSFNPLNSMRLAHSTAESLADRVGIVEEDFFFVTEKDFTKEDDLPKGWWWLSSDKRYFVFEEQPKMQIENIQSRSGKTWLRWATYNDIGLRIGMNQVVEIAKRAGYSPSGPPWGKEIKSRSRKRLSVFLVPVEKD